MKELFALFAFLPFLFTPTFADKRAYKGYGVKNNIPTAAHAAFCCDGIFSEGDTCGNITFTQQNYPYQPVVVEATLLELAEGEYQIVIHFWGDNSDLCENAGKRYHLLKEFEIKEENKNTFWESWFDYDISVTNHLGGIIGRSISVARKDDDEYADRVGCAVIGMADVEKPLKKKIIRTYDPVPDHLYYLKSQGLLGK